MDIISAYREVGSYRAAADICSTTPKTVKRIVETAQRTEAPPTEHNYDNVAELVTQRVDKTKGRITAKRLLPVARAAGYTGSDRNFRRLVADAKRNWRVDNHRGRRPGVWEPGDVLAIDWGAIGTLHVFCAVLAWSRIRFIYFADNERSETTLAALAACFEFLGGVPKTVLADRMGCLKGGVVANVVIPSPDYVRLATHYGFNPDFCEPADPASKGLVENLVGYAKSDLMIPEELDARDLRRANELARDWMEVVNAHPHSEICAIPAERLEVERELLGSLPELRAALGKVLYRTVDRLSCVRFASARYSVPTKHIGAAVEVRVADGHLTISHLGVTIAQHVVVVPGETSILDDHYGGPRPKPRRALRPRTPDEVAFCELGPVAELFIKGAAASGMTSLKGDLSVLLRLERSYGRDAIARALERAIEFGRFRASDVASILLAGQGVARPTRAGEALVTHLPVVASRSLEDYAMEINS
ncbi:MAG: IS21 family transposase [Actinobacteria bacterium 21-64-8]|nr:MAG: IS21 family transposase [Actinobacteria bacterium 21-64-8]